MDPLAIEPLPVLELVNALVVLAALACIFGGFMWLVDETREDEENGHV